MPPEVVIKIQLIRQAFDNAIIKVNYIEKFTRKTKILISVILNLYLSTQLSQIQCSTTF